MNGDIKLATLSDTDDTDVTATNIAVNGTFDADTDWVKSANWTISGGKANCSGGSAQFIYPSVANTTQGQQVVLKVTVTDYTSGTLYFSFSTGTSDLSTAMTATGTYTFSGTLTGNERWYLKGENFVGSIDNLEVYQAEEDRSVNGNGLQVFGTVTKDPVATNADLVAYSGFSDSNYLMQPYNSDLDFGTDDFCIMGWQKGTDAIGPFLTRNSNNANHLFTVGSYTTDKVWFSTGNGSGSKTTIQTDITTSSIDDDVWNCWCFVRRNGVLEVWLGGVLQGTKIGAVQDVSSTDAVLYLATDGPSVNYGGVYQGSLALWRISATAPSPEQIKKIYEDEKVLFQENAQATLYGSSDAVTALAYDDTTELLHVGTSAGRSVFQGLRRVDNTTTAVGAAISASNGLVADE